MTPNEEHVAEAILALDYVSSHFIKPLAAVLPRCTGAEHPHAVAREIRREGTQIPKEWKKELGLRSNAFMSVEAMAMLTEKGRLYPLIAIENTLLRAAFRWYRHRDIANVRDMAERTGHPAAARLSGVFPDCDGCTGLNKLIKDANLIEREFPITGCNRDACAVLVQCELDFYHGLK